MGCWNKTCGLSNLYINDNESVYTFVLVQNDDVSRCYNTSFYTPVLVPFECTYNDYGSGENVSGTVLAPLLAAMLEKCRDNDEVIDELNGPLNSLSSRLNKILSIQAKDLFDLIQNDHAISISYSDRYLKSPWSLMLLGGFLELFKNTDLMQVEIQTLYQVSNLVSNQLKHDWKRPDDQEAMIKHWLADILDTTVVVEIKDKTFELQHSREIIVNWFSGKKTRIVLDQGMGYWYPRTLGKDISDFNFYEKQSCLYEQMRDKYKFSNMVNSARWSTLFTII